MPAHGTTDGLRPPTPAASPPTAIEDDPAEPAPPPTAGRFGATFRSLRHRNYRLYFFGQLISHLGSWIQTTALTWLAFALTQQSKWVAVIAAAQILPAFILGAWGGALADRWPKRTLLLYTQSTFLVLALVLAGLVFGGAVTAWQLLAIAVLNGLVLAVDLPARLAFVMDMVGREDLMNAVALNALLFNVARAAGPALAGWLLYLAGPDTCFLLNGLSFVPLVYGLACMDVAGATPAHRSRRTGRLLDGFRYLAGRPELALLVLLAGGMALCGWPFLALLPAFAHHVLGVEEQGYSLLLTGAGSGALVAALVVASYGSWERQRRFIHLGIVILTLSLFLLSLARSLPEAVAACAGCGFGLILFFATSQSVLQLGAGDHNRGRVMGIWAMIQSGAAPLGHFLNGPAADRWGEPLVLHLQALGCAGIGFVLLALLHVRPEPPRSDKLLACRSEPATS
jgi:MFS family permease